jgi:hypothetical protein
MKRGLAEDVIVATACFCGGAIAVWGCCDFVGNQPMEVTMKGLSRENNVNGVIVY